MLGTMRWAQEIRSPDALDLPAQGASGNNLKPAELKMAGQLIEQMTSDGKPEQFSDDFTSAIRELVERKAKAGDKAIVEAFEEAPALGESNVVDLTELLRQSLGSKEGKGSRPGASARKPAHEPIQKKPARKAPPKGKKAA
jgi:DNA end-binding protein Ku